MYGGRLERTGVLIDPQEKRCVGGGLEFAHVGVHVNSLKQLSASPSSAP
jgi:hypothetical protein